MKKVIKNNIELKLSLNKLLTYQVKEPIVISVEKLYNKRTDKQLRSYWYLINTCKLFMNEQGNNFTTQDIDYYFKITSGHYIETNSIKIPRSIATNSNTTKQEMKNIIETILEFGINNNIESCYIDGFEVEELLKNYE